jgi:hypothetical protein
VLGIQLENEPQRVGLVVFFFLNAFLGVLNSVLVDGVFGIMCFEKGDTIITELKNEYGGLYGMLTLFTIYDILRSARTFFSILGMYSNVIFFMATALGSLLGGLVTKCIILSHTTSYLLKYLKNEKEDGRLTPNGDSDSDSDTVRLVELHNSNTRLTRSLFRRQV